MGIEEASKITILFLAALPVSAIAARDGVLNVPPERLRVARALGAGRWQVFRQPKVLLMDEPFGTLDALTRERMQEELHAVWRRAGMTVVFITHSVEEAVYLGTEVVVMSPRPGRIVARLPMPFAREHAAEGIRQVKSRPDFVEARERVLSMIWEMAEE